MPSPAEPVKRRIALVFVDPVVRWNPNERMARGGARRTSSGTTPGRMVVTPTPCTLVLTAPLDEMLTILGAFRAQPK
jgi:hypothetical protein